MIATATANTRNGNARTRLAVAAGSLVAVTVSAGISANAFLMDKAQDNSNNNNNNNNSSVRNHNRPSHRLRFHGKPLEGLPSVFRTMLGSESPPALWNTLSTRVWSRVVFAAAATNDDDDDERITTDAGTATGTSPRVQQAISVTLRNRFKVGDSYVWLYQDADGNPTSWEKYTVTGIEERTTSTHPNQQHDDNDDGNGGDGTTEQVQQQQQQQQQHKPRRPQFVATIEMSTKFEAADEYQTHHRIKANLIDHVVESSESREGWRIGFEYFLSDGDSSNNSSNNNDDGSCGGSWKRFGSGDNVQAFEEKFDVFSMVAAAEKAQTAAAAASSSMLASKATKGGAGDYTDDPRDECLVPWTTTAASTMLETRTHCDTETNPSTRSVSLVVKSIGGGSTSGKIDNTNDPPQEEEEEEKREAVVLAKPKNNHQTTTAKLTQTKRHGYTESWYGPSNHDTLSGIALYKEFPNSRHSFSLIERTTTTTTTTTTPAKGAAHANATANRNERGVVKVTDSIEVVV